MQGVAYFSVQDMSDLDMYYIRKWKNETNGVFSHYESLNPSESWMMCPPEGWDCN